MTTSPPILLSEWYHVAHKCYCQNDHFTTNATVRMTTSPPMLLSEWNHVAHQSYCQKPFPNHHHKMHIFIILFIYKPLIFSFEFYLVSFLNTIIKWVSLQRMKTSALWLLAPHVCDCTRFNRNFAISSSFTIKMNNTPKYSISGTHKLLVALRVTL